MLSTGEEQEIIRGFKSMLSRFQNFAILIWSLMVLFATAGIALSEDWSSYTPAHAVGSGNNDWWTTYPDQHQNASSAAKHPGWVLDDLKEKPVLILVHSSNCVPCRTQTPRIASTVDRFSDNLTYYDVLAEGSGFEKAVEILDIYDPNGGGQYYVPTTIFITLARSPDGTVGVAWHSQTDAMSQEDIDSYVKDEIYYYRNNVNSWS
jgi:thiol-disulfide isomerase/thioredoxin